MMRPGRAVPSGPAGGDDGMTWEPPDMSQPNAARVHNSLLAGHDNFAPDRAPPGDLPRPEQRSPGEPGIHRPRRRLGSPVVPRYRQ